MIIPAVLEDTTEFVNEQLDNLRQLSPQPQIVEIDIIDGEFAPHLTLDTDQLIDVEGQPFQLDIHLMVVEPTDFVYQLKQATERGNQIRAVIGQVERLHSLQEFVEEVQANEFQVGFALDLYTPVEAIDAVLLPDVQVISVLGGQAGEQGQEFKPVVLEKVRELAELKREGGYEFEIRVDVGMNADTIPLAQQAGANSFAVGSALKLPTPEAQQNAWEQLLAAQAPQE